MADCLFEQNLCANNVLPSQLNKNDSLRSSVINDQLNQKKSEYDQLTQNENIFQKIHSILFHFQEKKINYRHIFYLILFSFFLLYIFVDIKRSNKRKIMVYYDNRYQIEITKYNISYDIKNDSSMNITENITINYQGIYNTGFRRFIPIDNGVQIRNVQIYQITENGIEKVYHTIYIQNGNMVFDIGDDQLKYGKNESYFISYEFRILNKVVEKLNMIPLNVIGHEWWCKINNAFVKLVVPSEFTEAQCFVGPDGTTELYKKFDVNLNDKKTVISGSFKFLREFEGVTFNLYFRPNSVRSYADHSCFKLARNIILILLVLLLLSFNVYYNKNKIVPVRYTSALNTIDPLIMSKVLNGSVKRSDVPSIIFYWASKGFLNINFDNVNDPVLIRNVPSISNSSPQYQSYMFDELFKNGDVVKTSELKYKFYKTVNKVIQMVDSQTNRFVNNNSIVLSLLFAMLGSFWSFSAPLSMKKFISENFSFGADLVMYGVFLLILWIVRYNMTYKYIVDSSYIVECIISVCLSALSCFFYVINDSTKVISNIDKYSLCIPSILCVICSVWLITKTAYFKAKINEVFGFKEFIVHPVNEEFESFLKKDPELFYNFIGYAQVLNLPDKWKNKFDSLTVAPPPHWIIHSNYESYHFNNYNWMHHQIHCIKYRMIDNLVHSPPQKGSHGHGSSHSSHHGGGGFGGGGGCGR